MSQVRLLPDKLPPSPPLPKKYPVIYWLSKDIARYGVSYRRWINIERIEQKEDGVEIHGTTINPFSAVQELMHYRHKCKVQGGPEMLDQMKKTVEKMADAIGKDLGWGLFQGRIPGGHDHDCSQCHQRQYALDKHAAIGDRQGIMFAAKLFCACA